MTTITIDQTIQPVVTRRATPSMKGDGHYDANCDPQHADILQSQDLLLELAAQCPEPADGQSFVLADFGCGHGRTSCRAFEPVVGMLRRTRPHVTVNVFRNDLASNDFNALAHRIEPGRVGGVYEYMAPGSFHDQILPDNSLFLATCFSALHWLSDLPVERVAEHVTHEANVEAYGAMYAAHWQRGWQSFLISRAAELVHGGQFLISFIARSETSHRVHAPFELLQLAAESLVDDGHLSSSQMEQFQIPIHRPLHDEVLAPFGPTGFDTYCGLRVAQVEITRPVCPLFADWRRDRNTERYAYRYSEFIRAFTESVVRTGLLNDGGKKRMDDASGCSLLDCLYERIRRLILAEPARFTLRRTRITLVLQKVSSESTSLDPA
ncbi:MAG: hypothetical protein HQ518_10325 [Rhodopirellula sp.]|nr:hypothetical protein [Rhodopirellula sp.]